MTATSAMSRRSHIERGNVEMILDSRVEIYRKQEILKKKCREEARDLYTCFVDMSV